MNSVSFRSCNKKALRLRAGLFLFLTAAFVLLFAACNQKSVAFSFSGTMDEVDACLSAGQSKEAAALLKRSMRSASSAGDWLSIYKRYIRMGNAAEAGKVIKKAYAKNADRPEIVAVYSHYLLCQNKLETALKVAERLEGTQYGSILTEIKLRLAKLNNDYFKREFVASFRDAAYATGNDAYLRNAAAIEAYCGFIDSAMKLHPVVPMYNENKLFWATISFDAGNFTQTYIDLAAMPDSAEVMLLRADAALYLDEQQNAYSMWEKSLEFDAGFSPVPYYNLAHFADTNDMQAERGKHLISLVKYFPEYVPGLASYGNYAYDVMHMDEEDSITKAVRNAGFRSLRMEERDAIPLVPVEDALARMDSALANGSDTPLLIERAKLEWRNSERSNDERLIDIWLLLEQNPKNDELNQYGVWLLCLLRRYDEARSLFNKMLKAKYESDDYEKLAKLMTAGECEFAAYLSSIDVPCAQNPDYSLPSKIYEVLCSRNVRSVPVLMNYGAIKFSQDYLQSALELYNKALRLSADSVTKGEIQYRIARVYVAQNDVKNAMLCLSYCLLLNPDHAKARLLYKQLEGGGGN